MTVKSKREIILDSAEIRMRTVGYNGFSTREIANLVGIKAASVHYHFPSKADLGVAVTQRYCTRFFEALGEPSHSPAPIKHFATLFHNALINDKKLCLCLILGAETSSLPETMNQETNHFFKHNLEWLEEALISSQSLSEQQAKEKAAVILASFEGALLLSNSLSNPALFDSITAYFTEQ